jgi:Mg2+/Co2+ transporter CorC
VPLQGETITIDGITLKVENVIGRRILKVRATKDQPISLSGDEAYAD